MLAAEANKRLYAAVETAERMLGVSSEDSLGSHIADEFYGKDPRVDAALKNMGVAVEPPAEKAA
jgi:hypothetical protein